MEMFCKSPDSSETWNQSPLKPHATRLPLVWSNPAHLVKRVSGPKLKELGGEVEIEECRSDRKQISHRTSQPTTQQTCLVYISAVLTAKLLFNVRVG